MVTKQPSPKVKAADLPRYTNRAGIRMLFGVSDNVVKTYIEKGLPKLSRGVYDVQEVVKWYKLDKTIGTYHKSQEQRDATERLTLAKAIKQERENALQAEELVTWDRHLAVVGTIATIISNHLEALGARVASDVAAEIAPKKVQNHIWRESRQTLSSIVDLVEGLDLSEYEVEI